VNTFSIHFMKKQARSCAYRNKYRILFENFVRKRLVYHRHISEDNIKVELTEIYCAGV
jgi:hypothetical protein